MGLSSTTNRVSYACDGSSTVFSFPYKFFNPSDLQVFLFDTGSAIITTQSLNTNYTVAGAVDSQGIYPNGGTVVLNCAAPSTLQLIVTRSPQALQNYVLLQNQQINSLALVQEFDYVTALVQRLQDQVSRCVQIPDGQGAVGGQTFSTTLPGNFGLPTSANAPIVVNSGATGFTTGIVSTNGSSATAFFGVLPVLNGGTGNNTAATQGGVVYAADFKTLVTTTQGATGNVLISNGAGAPTWGSVSIGSGAVSAGSITGILATDNGGTGQGAPYVYPATGLIYASSATQFAGITPAASGLPLLSQASSVPLFQALDLTGSGITNTLPVSKGGTGNSVNFTQDGIIYASSATQLASTGAGGTDVPLLGNNNGAPSFRAISLTSGSSITGILPIASGGTGVSAIAPQYGLLYASSLTQVSAVPSAASGQILTANGSSAPTFQSLSLGSSAALIGALPISKGGTGQTAKSAGFDALSPTTTKGDLAVFNGSGLTNVRLGVGSDTFVLTADSSQITGLKWAASTGGGTSITARAAVSSQNINNTIATVIFSSVAFNASTIYNSSTGTVTFTTPGKYWMYSAIETNTYTLGTTSWDVINLNHNGVVETRVQMPGNGGAAVRSFQVGGLINAAANDTATISFGTTSNVTLSGNGAANTLHVYFVAT